MQGILILIVPEWWGSFSLPRLFNSGNWEVGFAPSPWLVNSAFFLCPHKAFPLCVLKGLWREEREEREMREKLMCFLLFWDCLDIAPVLWDEGPALRVRWNLPTLKTLSPNTCHTQQGEHNPLSSTIAFKGLSACLHDWLFM